MTELVSRTGLSRPTVDAVADELVRLGWLSEVAAVEGARGRPARSLAFRADAGVVLGVDIGEVKVRCAVADLRGRVVAERVREFGGEERLPVIRREVAAVSRARASCCSPASAAPARWTARAAPCCSRACSTTTSTSPGALALDCPVVIENDCNLAVIAERWCGAAAGLDDLVCVLAGERIGAGIMVGGALMRGHEGAAGELSFLGAFEQEHGARGIAQLVRELAGASPESVFIAAGAGDEEALEIVERAERWAGHGIVTTAQLVNPEVVVIGGGVARAGEVLLAPLRDRLQRMVRRPPRLAASPLAERGPLLGAIRLALDEFEPRLWRVSPTRA